MGIMSNIFLSPFTWECLLRLVLSAFFGAAVGLEREIRFKEAGIRTHLIVSLASCLMMLVSKYGFSDVIALDSVNLDPSRVAAAIVTGIGFLGAGTIFSRGRNVTGLTTAAGLWATVGIGMALGAGMYLVGIFTAILILVIQAVLHRDLAIFAHRGAVISITLQDDPNAMSWLSEALAQLGLDLSGAQYERRDGDMVVTLEVDHLPCKTQSIANLLQPLMQDTRVRSVRW